jgi:hypothetical protein
MNPLKKAVFKVMAKRTKRMNSLLFMMTGKMGKALYAKGGKSSLPEITAIAGESGAEMAAITRKMMPVGSFKDIDDMYKVMDLILGLGIETVEVSDGKYQCNISRCPYGLDGTSRELCEALMELDKKMVSDLLGKPVAMQIPQSLAAGDKKCRVIFTTG